MLKKVAAILLILISFSNITAFANTNLCSHENVYETLKVPYSCEFGDMENTICIYCKDCGKLIEEKETVVKDMHGIKTYIENDQIKCKICDRPVNEKVRLKNKVITKEEVSKYQDLVIKLKEELYPNIDAKRASYEKWLEDVEFGINNIDDKYYYKTCYLTGVIKELQPLDLSKLNSDLKCKNSHEHLILFIKLNKNLDDNDAKLILNYKCMDCNYDEYITYDKSKIDSLEERKELAKNNVALETFFEETNLLEESFLNKVINFFKKIFK